MTTRTTMTPREKAAGRLRERNLRTKVWATVLSARSRRATIPGVRAVLVVDDHPTFRRTARALLESGWSDVACRTGISAFREPFADAAALLAADGR
jgi:hypothetical protein